MKKMCAVLLIFLLLFQSACYAEENQYRASSYDDQDLLNAYEALGIMDGATIDALKSGLSIRIEEEMKGVTLKDNVLYILSGSGVYKISTNGNYVFSQ